LHRNRSMPELRAGGAGSPHSIKDHPRITRSRISSRATVLGRVVFVYSSTD
jgi:hypothetical protein